MSADDMLALGPGYAPFIHMGATNSSRSAGRKGARQVHRDTYGLWAVLNGTMRIEEAGEEQNLQGPAAAFLPPHPDRVVQIPAASDWYYLRFDIVDQPRRRRHPVKPRAWCHSVPVEQPGPAAIWGVTPPIVVPMVLCDSAIQVLRDCCALWWQDDLAHVQANASLGHWLADYAMACRDRADQEQRENRLLQRCRQLIFERLKQGVGVADLAAATGYSPSRFTERFIAETQRRPGSYIRECRLVEAARLLASDDLPVASIADECGYRSRAAFIRAFTKRYHCTPAEWRRKRR